MKSIYKAIDRCYNIVNASDCRERTEPKRKESRGKTMKRTEEQYNEYIAIIIDKTTGRADITVKTNEGNIYYYVEKDGTSWKLKRCINGFCYNSELVACYKTLNMAIEAIHDVCNELTVKYRELEEAESNSQTYKGYTITGNERTGIVALDPHGHFSSKVYKTVEEAIEDIDKDIADSVPTEETDSFELPAEDEEPVEVLDKAHEILSNPLTELDVRVSAVKSAFNRYYGNQVIDAEMNSIKTELTGFHVSGVITEIGTMMLSCDIYAQDLDITESYLAYNVGSGYAVYDEISLTRIEIFPSAESVKQFFASRVKALETETLKKLY